MKKEIERMQRSHDITLLLPLILLKNGDIADLSHACGLPSSARSFEVWHFLDSSFSVTESAKFRKCQEYPW